MRTVSSPRKSTTKNSEQSALTSVSDSSKSTKSKPALSNASLTRKLAKYYTEVCETRWILARVVKELDILEKLFKENERQQQESLKASERIISLLEAQNQALSRLPTARPSPAVTRPVAQLPSLSLSRATRVEPQPKQGLPPLTAKWQGKL